MKEDKKRKGRLWNTQKLGAIRITSLTNAHLKEESDEDSDQDHYFHSESNNLKKNIKKDGDVTPDNNLLQPRISLPVRSSHFRSPKRKVTNTEVSPKKEILESSSQAHSELFFKFGTLNTDHDQTTPIGAIKNVKNKKSTQVVMN